MAAKAEAADEIREGLAEYTGIVVTARRARVDQGRCLALDHAIPDQRSTLSGEGWTITLAAGWTVRPGKRPGDFEIVKAGN